MPRRALRLLANLLISWPCVALGFTASLFSGPLRRGWDAGVRLADEAEDVRRLAAERRRLSEQTNG